MWRRDFQRSLGLGALAALACAPLAGAPPDAPRAVDAADLKRALTPSGRPLLVHVWATWCAPCIAEWPRLAETLRGFDARPLDIVTVALDEASRRAAAARILAGAGGLPGRALIVPPAEAADALKTLDSEWDGAIPGTYLLDSDGRLLLAQRGVTRLPALAAEIDRITKRGARGARD